MWFRLWLAILWLSRLPSYLSFFSSSPEDTFIGFREGGRERERVRERETYTHTHTHTHTSVWKRDTDRLPLLCAQISRMHPYWRLNPQPALTGQGTNPQAKRVPWVGIKPVTFSFAGQCPTVPHWSGALLYFLMVICWWFFHFHNL